MSDNKTNILEIESAVVRFVGDSGDGMQLTGNQFTDTSAVSGNDVVTFPDFPAEIRAPAGTVGGVSGFQVNFSSNPVTSHGDAPDALVAMNPAALIMNVKDLKHGGLLVVNSDSFGAIDLRKAGIESNPLENDTVLHETYQVVEVGMTSLVQKALEEIDLKASDKKRCKNFFALGLMYWVYDRSLDFSKNWIKKKFAKKPILIEANTIALEAGYAYGETIELFNNRYTIKSNDMPSGTYRQVTGNSALAYGLTTATFSSGLKLVYGSYPITPASDILH
jgi:2-oxoglutarate ferredoxin oxidoreductase subunit alpha